jgi:O-antigen/teichoic acid export membrane protein
MKALLLGIVILAAAAFAVLPPEALGFGLGWAEQVLAFLKGGAPVLAVFIAIVSIFIGIADIKDRAEAKKEEKTAEENKE